MTALSHRCNMYGYRIRVGQERAVNSIMKRYNVHSFHLIASGHEKRYIHINPAARNIA
jgi:hypothetical protein